mgnify:CR=1 FL=1
MFLLSLEVITNPKFYKFGGILSWMNLQELHRLTIKLHVKELGRWQQHEIGFAKSPSMRRVQWKFFLLHGKGLKNLSTQCLEESSFPLSLAVAMSVMKGLNVEKARNKGLKKLMSII